ILLVCWLFAARTNAGTYSSMPFKYGRGWTVGMWFIPVAAYVLPVIVVREIHKGTVVGAKPGKPSGGVITGVWWTLWLGAVLSALIGVSTHRPTTIDDPNDIQQALD